MTASSTLPSGFYTANEIRSAEARPAGGCVTSRLVADAWRAARDTPTLSSPAPAICGTANIPVILFNGPPGSGKDTAAGIVRSEWHNVTHLKFAAAVKQATHIIYGLDCAIDAFESTKNTPSPEFGGLSPREAYILFSERAIKPTFGEDRFGQAAARRVAAARDAGAEAVVISDSGFRQEAEVVAGVVGWDNLLLVRLYATGRRCSFAGDSRTHITLPCESHDIENDGSLADFRRAVLGVVEPWLRGRMRRAV